MVETVLGFVDDRELERTLAVSGGFRQNHSLIVTKIGNEGDRDTSVKNENANIDTVTCVGGGRRRALGLCGVGDAHGRESRGDAHRVRGDGGAVDNRGQGRTTERDARYKQSLDLWNSAEYFDSVVETSVETKTLGRARTRAVRGS